MELQQIRYFLAIQEHGGFSRAAQACDASQPALTAAIKKLEAEIGAPVFHREGRRLVLTELGRLVKPHLEQVLAGTQTAREIARNFTLLSQAPLRVGVMATIGPVRVSRYFRRFHQTHPGVELYAAFRSEREDWIESMVLAGLGFAFMPEYSVRLTGLQHRPLVDPPVERTVLIADVRGRQRSAATRLFVEGIRAYKWPA